MGNACSGGSDKAVKEPKTSTPKAAAAPVVFVLGGPGSGKGTQCDKIKARYEGVVHLSAGDLLRAEVASGSKVGEECSTIMKEGKLVPLDITIGLLKKAMEEKKEAKAFLIDGFPRAQDQADRFEKDIGLPKAVLFFDCPEEEMEKRLLKRGETSGRSDDNAEAIRKRFHTFVNESLPVKDFYSKKSLAHVISAVPAPDDVFAEVVKALDPVLSAPKPAAAPKSAAVAAAAPTPTPDATAEAEVAPVAASESPINATIVFVLGGPGSGKGTQCEKIMARYEGVVHLSAGDLLRAEVATGSKTGEEVSAIIKEGKLVPVSVTIQLLKNAMAKNADGMKVVLIDGFPRAQDQADRFEKDVGLPNAVLFFDCPEEEMEKRLLKRGETSGRSDDNAEAIRKRFHTFVNESVPVKDYYAAKGLAHVISAVAAPDAVFAEVAKALDAVAPVKAAA